uniref:Copia protein n=1 Tax=Tanacetum cinerariifolium TaxID=118510 RepID=A0A699J004_TANCI|nr:copia protein [Tanacetum cinerariifolium]
MEEIDLSLNPVEPNSRDFTKDVVENISPTKEPQVLNTLPTHPTLQLNLKFQPSSESLFAYVVWIFLSFLVYSVVPCYLLSLRNEDIIFYPGICKSTFSKPDISHRVPGFIKILANGFYSLKSSYSPLFNLGITPIGTKWVLKNKKDGRGIVIRNKVRLVAQRHTQEEGIDYDEVFAPVTRIDTIRLFLAYASFMGFTIYQMDVKSAFLYGTINEDVYVIQPSGFQDPKFLARVYKVEKAMYGLHQAPRACDYGGATQDRKSTTRACQFFGRRSISWQCKKQTIMSSSTTKAEYVAAASGCGQVLWIQN